MPERGKFIVVDGCEGAGKTTLIKFLAGVLPPEKIFITHEPGGTPFAGKIRKLFLSSAAEKIPAETQFGLVWAARADHLRNKIKPALEKGINVVSDRFDSSTYAYQVWAGKAPHLKKLFWQTRKVFLEDCEPDLYIFLDVEPKIGLGRVAGRRGQKTHFDNRKLAYHRLVRKGFKEFFRNAPHKTINASRSLEAVKDNFLRVLKGVPGFCWGAKKK